MLEQLVDEYLCMGYPFVHELLMSILLLVHQPNPPNTHIGWISGDFSSLPMSSLFDLIVIVRGICPENHNLTEYKQFAAGLIAFSMNNYQYNALKAVLKMMDLKLENIDNR